MDLISKNKLIKKMVHMMATIFNGLYLLFLILFLVALCMRKNDFLASMLILLAISMIAYYYFVFTSEIYKMLDRTVDVSRFLIVLEKWFKCKPKYEIEVISYSMEGRGKKSKTITRTASKEISYNSWRDSSGKLDINEDVNSPNQNYPYALIRLKTKIEYARDGTDRELENVKSEFLNSHQYGDSSELVENVIIEDFEDLLLLKLSNYEPCLFNRTAFIVVCIFPLFALYEFYLSSWYKEQTFTIVKLISTRTDLSNPEYAGNDPVIKIQGVQKRFSFFGPIQGNVMFIQNPANIPIAGYQMPAQMIYSNQPVAMNPPLGYYPAYDHNQYSQNNQIMVYPNQPVQPNYYAP